MSRSDVRATACGSAPNVRQHLRSPTGSGTGSGSGAVVVSAETVTPSRSVSIEPEGRSCVVSATPIARPKSASTRIATVARIQTKAFGIEQRPVVPAVGQCASTSGAAGDAPDAGATTLTGDGRSRERRSSEADDAPGQRILEEPGVEEGVHDERAEDRAEADAQWTVDPGDQVDRPRCRAEQPCVDGKADHAELGEDRQRRRV